MKKSGDVTRQARKTWNQETAFLFHVIPGVRALSQGGLIFPPQTFRSSLRYLSFENRPQSSRIEDEQLVTVIDEPEKTVSAGRPFIDPRLGVLCAGETSLFQDGGIQFAVHVDRDAVLLE